jgi:hypothetical protein
MPLPFAFQAPFKRRRSAPAPLPSSNPATRDVFPQKRRTSRLRALRSTTSLFHRLSRQSSTSESKFGTWENGLSSEEDSKTTESEEKEHHSQYGSLASSPQYSHDAFSTSFHYYDAEPPVFPEHIEELSPLLTRDSLELYRTKSRGWQGQCETAQEHDNLQVSPRIPGAFVKTMATSPVDS